MGSTRSTSRLGKNHSAAHEPQVAMSPRGVERQGVHPPSLWELECVVQEPIGMPRQQQPKIQNLIDIEIYLDLDKLKKVLIKIISKPE